MKDFPYYGLNWKKSLTSRLPGRKNLMVTLMLPFLAVLFLVAAATPLPPRPDSDDVSIAHAIEEYISKRSEILGFRVDFINIKKLNGEIDEGTYESTWQVLMRFRADYARPEEDPYLAGMLKCLNERKTGSDDDWVEWAEDEINKRRLEVRDLMSYAQELEEQVAVVASTDASGRVDAGTIRLRIGEADEAQTVEGLLADVPPPELYEAAGYKFLEDARSSSGDPAPPGQQDPPTVTGEHDPGSPPKKTQEMPTAIKPTTRSPQPQDQSRDPSRDHLIFCAVGVLGILLLILVASEVYNQKKKRSAAR
ncbi:MAG TPA: hypothetical protein GX716_03790 [Firmicutes bacterium]|nr:hypothetical protein [Candidatus Fermentithermobacillaceae bacterium]